MNKPLLKISSIPVLENGYFIFGTLEKPGDVFLMSNHHHHSHYYCEKAIDGLLFIENKEDQYHKSHSREHRA